MSELVFRGKIESIHDVQEGVSNAGNPWKKISFTVMETEGQYPKLGGFSIFGLEKVDKFLKYNQVGQEVEVSFNVESREYEDKNGIIRVGTDLGAWRVQTVAAAPASPEPDVNVDEDDLPF